MAHNIITQSRLKELLSYDETTGLFTWLVYRNAHIKIGQAAGSSDNKGYTVIWVDGKRYKAHRLAWLYVTGEFPSEQIDHKNGKRSDNAFSNLRLATNQFNGENKRNPKKNNMTGLLGTQRHQNGFMARIMVKGKRYYLGMFATTELAHDAYVTAKRLLHKGCTL